MSDETSIVSLGEFKQKKEEAKKNDELEIMDDRFRELLESMEHSRKACLELGIIGQSLIHTFLLIAGQYGLHYLQGKSKILTKLNYKSESALDGQISYLTAGMINFHLPGNYEDSEKSFFDDLISCSIQWTTTPWEDAVEPYKEEVGPGYALIGIGGPFPLVDVKGWLNNLDPEWPCTELLREIVEVCRLYPPMWTYEEITPNRSYLRINFNHISGFIHIILSRPENKNISPVNALTLISNEEGDALGKTTIISPDGTVKDIKDPK